MEEMFTERLKRTGLDNRTQLILALDPGILFGFGSPDLDRMIERVDCHICLKIMDTVEKIIEDLYQLDQKINIFCKPARDRNELLKKNYEWWQRIPFLRWISRSPKFEAEPNHKDLPWYVETIKGIDEIEIQLELFKQEDPDHWGDEENKKISKNVVRRFITRNNTTYISGL